MTVLPREAAAMVVLTDGDTELASWPLLVDGAVDFDVVDRLAGLQLAARRMGCSIGLRLACPDLVALLDLAGLAEVIRLRTESRQMGGKPESGEQPLGVEEVVVPDDPVA
jgi:hypothetical protein